MAWTDPPADWASAEVVTNTKMNTHVRDQLKELWRRVARVEFTADVSILSTATEGSPVDVVSSGAITYAAYPTIIKFSCVEFAPGAGNNAWLSLWDASTDLGRVYHWLGNSGVTVEIGLTPSAASHTYKIRAWPQTANTGTAKAGTGGVGAYRPGHIEVWQKGGA